MFSLTNTMVTSTIFLLLCITIFQMALNSYLGSPCRFGCHAGSDSQSSSATEEGGGVKLLRLLRISQRLLLLEHQRVSYHLSTLHKQQGLQILLTQNIMDHQTHMVDSNGLCHFDPLDELCAIHLTIDYECFLPHNEVDCLLASISMTELKGHTMSHSPNTRLIEGQSGR